MNNIPIKTILVLLIIFSFSLIKSGQAQGKAIRETDPNDIRVPEGYNVEAYISDLSVPISAIFDGEDMIIAESGFVDTAQPRVLKVTPEGDTTVLAEKGLVAPVTGLLMVDGSLYISHKGKVSILKDGRLEDIVTGLPSRGDHQNNKLVLGNDGKIYLGQGTVTNSGVVGEDNFYFGWLKKESQEHDVPCQDITLTGLNFETDHIFDEGKQANTGAFLPYGTASTANQVIKGDPKCNGSILRFNSDGSELEMYAWGMRNPFGVALDQKGELWATYHGADTRGSRSIAGDPDYLVKVEEGGWYGWPDFYDGEQKAPFLLKTHPKLARAFTTFQPHSGANGLAFAPQAFGYEGDGFVAMFGTFAPVTSDFDVAPAGFRIARVAMRSGEVSDFATNSLPGPGYVTQHQGFNRPSDVVFGPDGALYVTDFSAGTLDTEGLKFVPNTGVIWRIYPDSLQPMRPEGPILVAEASGDKEDPQPFVKNVPELYKELSPQLATIAIVLLAVVVGIVWLVRRK